MIARDLLKLAEKSGKRRRISIYIDGNVYEEFKALCERLRIAVPDAIEFALNDLIEHFKKGKK